MKKRLLSVSLILCILLSTAAPAASAASVSTVMYGADTIMIYNPLAEDQPSLTTGNMSGQTATDSGGVYSMEAELASEGEEFYFADQSEFLEELAGVCPNPSLYTEKVMMPHELYSVGDTRTFHYQPGASYTGASASFTCLYSGTSCLIWGYGYSDTDIADALGREFDTKIMPANTENFGTARYIEDGDKLNILIYTMYSSGLCGYFRPRELLNAAEMGSYANSYNSGEAVIHINSSICTTTRYKTYGYVTLAHEYQHLINFSSTLLNPNNGEWIQMGTWLNEAMSMQAEELIYPGEVAKQGYITGSYNDSGDIATGQSLYDFSTTNDIGVYGQGFLFSEYLKQQSGTDRVFSRMHSTWRSSSGTALNDGAMLRAVLPSSAVADVNNAVTYPSAITTTINNADDVFLSKLNLCFQIGVLVKQGGLYTMPDSCSEAMPKLYTGSSCSIDAGGRIFVKTANGNSYAVPSNADPRLIYVGFKDGKVVIPPTTAADYTPNFAYTITAQSNDSALGTVSLSGNKITAVPAEGCGYAAEPYTVVSGAADVLQSGDVFSVFPSSNCVICINFEERTGNFSLWDGSSSACSPNGSVYTVRSAGELSYIADLVNKGNDLSGYTIRLASNIDLNHIAWTPVGNDSSTFRGTLDGAGYTISNLYINRSGQENTGLIGYSSDAVVQNLTLDNILVNGGKYTGGIIGWASGATLINCHLSGSVTGSDDTGGLVGYGAELISECTANVTVTGTDFVGGISGSGAACIEDCYAEGCINADKNMGMIAGAMVGSALTRCGAAGTISSTGSSVAMGGVIGNANNVTISQCWSNVLLTATAAGNYSDIGGIVGDAYQSTLLDCYALGNINAGGCVGGIVGTSSGGSSTGSCSYTNCYYAGKILSGQYRGGIAGYLSSTNYFTHCYFNKSGCIYAVENSQSYSDCTGLFFWELQDPAELTGFDFDTVWNISKGANDDYPFFRWQTFPVSAVIVNGDANYLFPGETMQLSIEVRPDVAKDTTYTIYSSNPAIASVSETGLVSAVRGGQVVISVKANGGDFSAAYPISVLEPDEIAAGFDSGTGTEDDPYIVVNRGNLEHLALLTNLGYSFAGQYIEQTNDINVRCTSDSPWTPIGSSAARPFMGNYYGDGFTVSGLYTDSSTGGMYHGLFGFAEDATICMVHISNSSFSGAYTVGAVVGAIKDSAVLCCMTDISVVVSGTLEVGGIVGQAYCTSDEIYAQIGFCSNRASVSGNAISVGGILGSGAAGTLVVACRNFGALNTTGTFTDTGGILGTDYGAQIASCSNEGEITGQGTVGGIVGYSSGLIMQCYNSASVYTSSTELSAGGIAGWLKSDADVYGSGFVIQCYNAGSVSAPSPATKRGIVATYDSGCAFYSCYVLSGLFSDTDELTNSLTVASSLSGWDFDTVWTYLSQGTYKYPVLRVFHPVLATTDALIFDKAAFTEQNQDITVMFNTYGNVMIGIKEGDAVAGAVSVTSDSNYTTATATIGQDYLSTLSVGTHELTACFAADCQVPFQIQVIDTTLDQFLYAATDVRLTDDTATVNICISSPKSCEVKLIAACYQDKQFVRCEIIPQALDQGKNDVTVVLPDYNDALEYKIMLLDAEMHTPLVCPLTSLLPEDPVEKQVPPGTDPVAGQVQMAADALASRWTPAAETAEQ